MYIQSRGIYACGEGEVMLFFIGLFWYILSAIAFFGERDLQFYSTLILGNLFLLTQIIIDKINERNNDQT